MNNIESTKHQANELFIKEGPQNILIIKQNSKHSYSLISTSGTNYHTGTKDSCIERKHELLAYALIGKE